MNRYVFSMDSHVVEPRPLWQEGLSPQSGLLPFIEPRAVLTLTTASGRGGAGGVEAVGAPQVVGHFGIDVGNAVRCCDRIGAGFIRR